MKTIEYYMNLPYRLELVPDTDEGGFVSAHTKHGGFGFIKFCKFTMERQISLEIIGISAFWVTGFLTANRLLSNTAEETDFLNGLPFAI